MRCGCWNWVKSYPSRTRRTFVFYAYDVGPVDIACLAQAVDTGGWLLKPMCADLIMAIDLRCAT